MLLFLRVVALLIIIFASWGLAVAAPNIPDIHIKTLDERAVNFRTPSITIRPVPYKEPGEAIEFAFRPDIPDPQLAALKGYALRFDLLELFKNSSLSVVIEAPRDQNTRSPKYPDIRILTLDVEDVMPWTPWITAKPAPHIKAVGGVTPYEFIFRPDLPEATLAELKLHIFSRDLRSMVKSGVWLRINEIPEGIHENWRPEDRLSEAVLGLGSDAFYFFGYDCKVPNWIVHRLFAVSVIESINMALATPRLGDFIASLRNERITQSDPAFEYPIKPEWTILDLLRAHETQGNSVLCREFLDRLRLRPR